MGATADDYLKTGRFEVSIDGDKVGSIFREIDGMSASIEVMEYQQGGVNDYTHKILGPVRYSNIILRKGVTVDTKMWDWIKSAIDGKIERANGSIRMCGLDGEPKMVVKFTQGWPCRWSGAGLDSEDTDLAIEELEITHEGLTFEKYGG